MISAVPGPIGMLMRCGRNDFNRTRWGRTYANDNLRPSYTCAEKNGASYDQ